MVYQFGLQGDERPMLEILKKDFFFGTQVGINEEHEGQGLDEQRNFVLGCRAGPGVSLSNLVHEMCHLAELDVSRLLRRPSSSWGLRPGKYWEVLGQSGYEPSTDASVWREMRVFAYQWSVLRHYNLPTYDDSFALSDLVSAAKYLPAFCIWQHKQLPAVRTMGYQEGEEATIDHLTKIVEHLSRHRFTFGMFQQAWRTRTQALQQDTFTTDAGGN